MVPDDSLKDLDETGAVGVAATPDARTLATGFGALVAGLFLAAGCEVRQEMAAPGVAFTLRDSAGLSIAESSGALWKEAPDLRWSVDTVPLLQVGGVEDSVFARVYPVEAAVRLEDGRIVVAGQYHTVLWYRADGTYLFERGKAGDGPGELRSVDRLAVTGSDSIAVYDASRRRWVIFDGAGNPRPFRLTALDCSMSQAVRSPDGRWLGWCISDHRAVEITPGADRSESGALGLSAGGSQGPTPDYLSQYRLVAVTQDGARLDTLAVLVVPKPQTIMAVPVFAATGSEILLGDAQDHVLTGMTPEGVPLRSIRWVGEDLTVPPADHARWRQSKLMDRDVKRQIASQSSSPFIEERFRQAVGGVTLPERKGAYVAVVGDPDGAIWVRLNTFFDEPEVYSVLAPEGRYLGEVKMPRNVHVTQIGRDFVLGLWWDDATDLEFVRLFRLRKP